MSNVKYTQEQNEWLKKQDGKSYIEIMKGFNERFNTSVSKDAIIGKVKRLSIRSIGNYRTIFSKEQQEFVEQIIPGKLNSEVAEIMNEKFNLNITSEQIRCWKNNRGLKSGVDTRFSYGNNPKDGMYKIGDETETGGYIFVKTGTREWKLKHRLVWEKANGKVPKGHKIYFKNGDTTDCELSNLILLSPQEIGIVVGQGIAKQGVEYRETGFLMAKLSSKLKNLGSESSENNIRASS